MSIMLTPSLVENKNCYYYEYQVILILEYKGTSNELTSLPCFWFQLFFDLSLV